MKTRLTLLSIFMIIASILFCSCQIVLPGTTNGSKDTDVTLIINDGSLTPELRSLIYNSLTEKMGKAPEFSSDSMDESQHEIVVGPSRRSISQIAYNKLEALERENKDDVGYVIYFDGKSVAIAYDVDTDYVAAIAAIEYFNENYAAAPLSVAAGTTTSDVIWLTEHYNALGEQYVNEKWQALKEADSEYGALIVDSFKAIYNIYKDEMVVWMAELYDPGIGGWYYSNSARDTFGFLPDIESTRQILSIISDSGMLTYLGVGAGKAFPEETRNQIISFIKSLQSSSDGNFYHPQWGTNINESRRSRDLGNAVSILKTFGSKPTYDTPNGDTGDGIKADGTPVGYMPLTQKLTTSPTVTLVSKVIYAAESTVKYPAYMETVELFEAWYTKLDIKNNSYSAGNTLTSIDTTIIARDMKYAELYANDPENQDKAEPIMPKLLEWLTRDQNTETGTWDFTGEASYYAVNGLMKTSGVFGAAGVLTPNADKGIETAIAAITSDEKCSAVVDIYNTWFAASRLISQIRKYGTEEQQSIADEAVALLRSTAPQTLSATAEKIAIFQKTDGSFSYKPKASSHNSQGSPAAVPNTNEGDVNATCICTSDILNYIYSAMELSEYKVPIYTHSDWLLFIDTLQGMSSVSKNPPTNLDAPATFDDDYVGDLPTEVTFKNIDRALYNGSLEVIKDPREGASGNVLKIVKTNEKYNGSQTNDNIVISTKAKNNNASCSVFEGEFCLTDATYSYPIQVHLTNCYLFTIRISNNRINIIESSSDDEKASKNVDLGLHPEFGEWFKIRVEYYPINETTARIKFFYNGELISVSDNYFDQAGDKFTALGGKPTAKYENTKIFFLKAANCTLLLDNLAAYHTNDEYVPITDPNNQPKFNIDAPVPEGSAGGAAKDYSYFANESIQGTRYDFKEQLGIKNLYSKEFVTVKDENGEEREESKVSIPKITSQSGEMLNVDCLASWQSVGVALDGNTTGGSGKKYVFETDFLWTGGAQQADQIASGAAFVGFLGEDVPSIDNTHMSCWSHIKFDADNPDVMTWFGVKLTKGVYYNIRMEYDFDSGICKVYVDNELKTSGKFNSGNNSDKESFGAFGIYFRKNFTETISMKFDNMYLGVMDA